MKRTFIALAPALLAGCQSVGPGITEPASASQSPCASPEARQEVSETIRAFFAALAVDDHAAVQRLTTANFYAYEIGKRYTGPALSKLIADAHAAGRVLQWNIGSIDARIDCHMASAVWENTGASGTAAKMEPRAWLESAVLLRQGNRWVIDFLHSTPKDPRP